MSYEMEIRFLATIAPKKINDIMHNFGFDETLIVKDALTITLTQTLPFVPDDNYLRKIADIIKNNYNNENIEITSCRFDGYNYFRQKDDTQGDPNGKTE